MKRSRSSSAPARGRRVSGSTSSGLPPEAPALEGIAVGLEPSFGIGLLEDGRVDGRLLPGRHWLATTTGWAAHLDLVEGEARAAVTLGQAALEVTCVRPMRVQLVPADADAFARLLAARTPVRIGPDSPGLFHADPGRYALVGEAGVLVRELDLPAEGLRLAID